MNEDIDKMLTNKKLVSYRVLNYIGTFTKGDICELLNMSRPTLDRRLKQHSWRYKEIETITKNMPL